MAARQTTSKAAQGLLPQIEDAIAYLNEEITQIRSGLKDATLHDLVADPLPRDQFPGLLQVWKLPPVPMELSKMFVQLEELREEEAKAAAEAKATADEEERKRKVAEEEEEQKKWEVAEEERTKQEETAKVTEIEKHEDEEDSLVADEVVKSSENEEDGDEEEEEQKKSSEEPKLAENERDKEKQSMNPAETTIAKTSEEISSTSAVISAPVPTPATPVKKDESVVSPAPPFVSEPAHPTPPVAAVSPPVAIPAVVTVAAPVTAPPPPVASAPLPPPPVVNKMDAARELALANLRALRKSMMLDVLSKIVSVAKSKGVDPAMFSTRAQLQASSSVSNSASLSPPLPLQSSFIDLEMIRRDVSKGSISEWEHFAQQVYLFCQHVIAEAEKQDHPDAKQKGVELLHFAKTLTETLRKASLKKEETLMQRTSTPSNAAATTTVPGTSTVATALMTKTTAPVSATAAVPPATVKPAPTVTIVTKFEPTPSVGAVVQAAEAVQSVVQGAESGGVTKSIKAVATTSTALPYDESSPKSSTLSVATEPTSITPHRVSARLRHRENSFTDSPSPQRRVRATRVAEEDQGAADSGVETRGGNRKHPRVAAPLPTTNDELSATESQQSEATADGDKRRTRKRRPILPATRASSRQQKRRATEAAKKAAAAAAKGDDGDDDLEAAEHGDDHGTEEHDSDAGDDTGANTEENDEDDERHTESDSAKAPTPGKSVVLTKSGRPRKKPGRKPKRKSPNDGQ